MTIPQWTLLGFTTWTLLLLMATVGVYRWGLILFAKAGIASFPPEAREGAGWYQRGTRAHANCIENLPVFGAIVLALYAGNVTGSLVDKLAIAILIARIMQSLVHVGLVQTNTVASIRFAFFFVQIVAFLWLIGIVITRLT